MYYLTEKIIMKEDEKISEVVQKVSKYFKLSDDCNEFFLKEGVNFTINKLVSIFEYFEQLCYDDLIKTLPDAYKEEIPEEIKEEIKIELLDKKVDSKITIKDLGAATRRFMSRYLVWEFELIEIQENRELVFYLTRKDLWDRESINEDELAIVIFNLISKFKLNVKHVYSFYNLIGDEDKQFINNIINS